MSGAPNKPTDFFAQSDEDFMKSIPPEVQPEDKTEQVETPATVVSEGEPKKEELAPVQEEPKTEADLEIERQQAEAAKHPDNEDDDNADPDKKKTEPKVEGDAPKGEDLKPEDQGAKKDVEKGKPEAEAASATPPDYEGFYKQMMTPFKANGKTIELKSPEEALKLMQMGANYTKSMQQLAPVRRIASMLQNNDLLDESKLSYLIDLSKHNVDAIKKLVKDSGLDPLEINTEEASAYRPNNHGVTDEQVNFDTVLGEINSTPEGNETIQVINKTWDQVSKEALWNSPQIMEIMHQQRALGIYDQITTEIERQRTVGNIPRTMPFLEAYKRVGDELQAAKAFKVQKQEPELKTPIAKSTPAPKSVVSNDDAAKAAAATKQVQGKETPKLNPLAMSDDEFLKQMSNRL